MNKIRIGNQTAYSALSVMLPFEYAVENSFDTFEWFPDKQESGAGWDENDLSNEDRLHIKSKAEECGISLSVHAPWQANPLNSDSGEILRHNIELAKDIGANLFNIHLYTEEGIDSFFRAITPLIEETHRAGIKLSIENTPATSPEDFNHLFSLIKNMNGSSEHVGLCFDLGHANLCDSTRNDYIAYIRRLDKQVPIIHIHLHENYGDHDSHLTIFTGPAGENDGGIYCLIDHLKKFRFEGSIIMEQWPEPQSLLNSARDRMYSMFKHKGVKYKGDERKEKKEREVKVKSERKKEPKPIEKREPEKPVKVKAKCRERKAASLHMDDLAKSIIEANCSCRSWREKLDWVRSVFTDERFAHTSEQLIYFAIYLHFLNTGEITCTEDGRHFRPCHHAKMSRDIHERLIEITTPENAFIIRKIYPKLPSYDSSFTRAEPLTRIRDIAHRNDIPKDLKREIKTTLQNKLHRCAGPEDLITSASILERITVPGGNYSHDFVKQFIIFHQELKEFFNASSCEELLTSMAGSSDCEKSDLINNFLASKRNLEKREGKAEIDEIIKAVDILTELRIHFIAKAEKTTGSEAHQLMIADIGLDDLAFVIFSTLNNAWERFVHDHKGKSVPVSIIKALLLAVNNLRLSNIFPDECLAVQSELEDQIKNFESSNRDSFLRMKASVERSSRLAGEYSDKILTLFFEKVELLGRALNVDEYSVRVFCEGDIRGNMVFQLSRLSTSMLKVIRERLDLPPWDSLVTGTASGRLVCVESLGDLSMQLTEKCVAHVKRADGEEEITKGLTGIILGHELPHLSHLAVRARQEGVVFTTCEEATLFEEAARLKDQYVTVTIESDSVKIEVASSEESNKFALASRELSKSSQALDLSDRMVDVKLKNEKKLCPVNEIEQDTGGGKAFAARRLEQISGEFLTPLSLVIPFGVMEELIEASSQTKDNYSHLLKELGENCSGEPEEAIKAIYEIIENLAVPDEIIRGIKEAYGEDERIMVRSSANCEDLEEISGAGLYDSIANVSPSEAAGAIKKVWVSLWTRRAVISRRQAGIPHEKAHMAVLIQKMITPDYSFIMHTQNPVSNNSDEIYVELAVGMGETLASGAVRGVPYRMVCNKKSEEIKMLSYASFSHSLAPEGESSLKQKRIDYTRIALSTSMEEQKRVGRQLREVGILIEKAFGAPQDIEGAIKGNEIYLVQSRPQQGVKK